MGEERGGGEEERGGREDAVVVENPFAEGTSFEEVTQM